MQTVFIVFVFLTLTLHGQQCVLLSIIFVALPPTPFVCRCGDDFNILHFVRRDCNDKLKEKGKSVTKWSKTHCLSLNESNSTFHALIINSSPSVSNKSSCYFWLIFIKAVDSVLNIVTKKSFAPMFLKVKIMFCRITSVRIFVIY